MNTEHNPAMEYAPPVASAPSQQSEMLRRLEQVLARFEISIAEANDLVALHDYEIVVLCDDSGSMRSATLPPHLRTLGQPSPSRWDELRNTCSQIVEIGACFDESGIDVYFLNRPMLKGVKSANDPAFVQSFQALPTGTTPLTEAFRGVAAASAGERKVLLFVFTDGEPNGGKEPFKQALRQLGGPRLKVQIMACTDADDEIGWLNDLDKELGTVDVTDDYHAERAEVLRAGLAPRFSRGDWCIKAMLGPIVHKFDQWDEKLGGKKARPHAMAAQSGCCTLM